MGASSIERYVEFGLTARTFLVSKPPFFSEQLREGGKKCIELEDPENLSDQLYPYTPYHDKLYAFANQNTTRKWNTLPWAREEKADLFKLFSVLIPFTDDLPFKLDSKYFPSDEIAQVMNNLSGSNVTLDHSAQLEIAEVKPNTIIWDIYKLSLALRVFARNRDQEMGVTTDLETATKVLSRLPLFPKHDIVESSDHDKLIAVNGGDWYHYWTCIVLGAMFEKHKTEINLNNIVYKLKFWGYEFLLTNTDTLGYITRGKKNKCGFHEYADKLGFTTGERIAQILDGN